MLGAAVTEIPSAPLPVPPLPDDLPRATVAPLPPWEVPAAAPPVVVTPVAPEVATEIAQLIASGEAWRPPTPAPAVAPVTLVPAPCAELPAAAEAQRDVDQVPQVVLSPAPEPASPAPSVAVPVPVASGPAAPPVGLPQQSDGTARGLLEAALAELTDPQEAAAPAARAEVPTPRRVQLGFRDGTSAELDPASTQALALEELAQSLTRKE